LKTTAGNRRGSSKSAGNLRSDVTVLFNDQVRVYRTKHSGEVYQMQMYVASEKKYIRKSLKTRDKSVALDLAEKEFVFYKSKINNNEIIFSPIAEEFREAYLKHVRELVSAAQIREGRGRNITTHTKRFIEFVGAKTKVSQINPTDFQGYRAFRQTQKHDITMTVVRNESISIKQMLRWGKVNGFIRYNFEADFGKIRVPTDESKRLGMSDADYKAIVDTARLWYKQGSGLSEEEVHYRRLIRDFVVLMGNFGFRTQELRFLQFKDVSVREDGTAEVTVRAENTKVNKRRTQRSRRGDVFIRRREYQVFNDDEDFIFSHFRKREVVTKEILYEYWSKLKNEVAKRNESFDVGRDLYDIRHFFITAHLRANRLSIWEIAMFTGTSVTQIEKHYNHVNHSFVSDKMLSYRLKFNDSNMLVLPDEYGEA